MSRSNSSLVACRSALQFSLQATPIEWTGYGELVLAIHDRLLVEHGGGAGVRDESLLQSALARPVHHIAYANSDIIELAAKYTAGIVQNHRLPVLRVSALRFLKGVGPIL